MYIFRALGRDCVPYLPATVPVLLRVIRECEDGSREFMYAQLARLVGVVQGHVRRYLDDIFDVIRRFWAPALCYGKACVYRDCRGASRRLPSVFPRFSPRIVGPGRRALASTAVPATLRALESFGSAADEHLHLALPAPTRCSAAAAASVPIAIRARPPLARRASRELSSPATPPPSRTRCSAF